MNANPKTVDTEFELFWREIGEAVHLAELTQPDKTRTLTVERGTRGATVKFGSMKSQPKATMVIGLYEVTPKQPALIVP